jgi:hypothetical protein
MNICIKYKKVFSVYFPDKELRKNNNINLLLGFEKIAFRG